MGEKVTIPDAIGEHGNYFILYINNAREEDSERQLCAWHCSRHSHMWTWIFNRGNLNGTNTLKCMIQTPRPMGNKRASEIPNGAAWDSIAHIC